VAPLPPPSDGSIPSAKIRAKAYAALRERTAARAALIKPVIDELRKANVTTPRDIAEELNRRNIPTARGDGIWGAVQVSRVLAVLAEP
jgi:hypothetical protein